MRLMVTKIGKIFLFFSLPWVCKATTLELSIENSQGIPLLSVGRGGQFLIVIRAKDADSMQEWPTVEGLEKIQVIGRRSDINVVMQGNVQNQQRRFIYTAIANAPGVVVLGPARADSKESGKASITILDAQTPRKETFLPPKYELILEKKSGVVGEKMPFILRFTYQDPELSLVNLAEPQIPGLRKAFLDEGTAGSLVINNELFSVIEYRGYMYPEHSGVFAFPSLRADYSQRINEQSALGWGFFGFGALAQKKSVFTQPQSLRIDNIPTTVPVAAVGSFRDFTATLSSPSIPQGEAVVLTLFIKGEGDTEKMKPPLLVVPDTIRFYESKSTIVPEGKTWEYVLQGLQEGTYTIKEQSFTYFDTKSRTVKTLKTKPLTLTITPGLAAKTMDQSAQKEELLVKEPEKAQQPLSKPSQKGLPFSLWLLLFLLPPFVIGFQFFFTMLNPFLVKARCSWRAFWALRRASKRIYKACKVGNLASLADIMKKALFDHYCINTDEYDSVEVLMEHGWNAKKAREWADFWQELLSYTNFAPESVRADEAHRAAVCKKAQNWLETIRRGPQ